MSTAIQKLSSEFTGTFCLVLAGTGAIVSNQLSSGAVSHTGIALTFGLIVWVMIATFADRSGAHFNPAVSLALAAAGRFSWRELPGYLAVQCLGALSASLLLKALVPTATTLGVTAPSGPAHQSFLLETVLTLILMLVILSVSDPSRKSDSTAGLAIGATVALEALFAGPISGASMNPARSLGPALASGELGSLWIYCAGPCLGALLSLPLCRCTRGSKCCPPPFPASTP
jgi:aquaporin NIP